MTRRQFLATTSLAASAQVAKRPNVVYIVTDDQRWDLLSLRGHPFVKTPNMDRIGVEGALFVNSFVTTSLCSPSRASFMTGRYPHQHQVQTNGRSAVFDKSEMTFPRLLHEVGYHTAYIGKWHIGNDSAPRPGFDYWAVLPGQGAYFDPEVNVNGALRTFEGHVDAVTASLATGFLESRPDPQPFCLCVGIKSPHAQQLPPNDMLNLLNDVEVPKPPSWAEDYAVTQKPQIVGGSCIQADRFFHGPRQLKGSWDRYIKDFYRCVMSADRAVGQILDTLDRLKLTDNTLVVFVGDNGFFLGEHRLVDKRFAYEEALRIPMLMRYPGAVTAGTVVPQIVLNIDVCPTILDFCGATVPTNISGKSVRPLLNGGGRVAWREEMLYDYRERIWQTPALVAIRTERFKYIEYLEGSRGEELYDLLVDPGEMRNLAPDKRHAALRADMRRRLERLKEQTGWTPPDTSRPNTPCLQLEKPQASAVVPRAVLKHAVWRAVP